MTKIKSLGLICYSILLLFGCTTFNISATDNNVLVDARDELKFESVIERTKESVVLLIASTAKTPSESTADQNSICTGAVVGEMGHIVTNFHCIYEQAYIRVYYWEKNDWKEHKVNIIGVDPLADLALLEVSDRIGYKIPSLKFAEGVKVGEEVFALGHPMGMAWTVTKGIISSTDRHARHSYIKSLQTDAAINKGNSGGPLLNMRGEIVGINSLIVSRVSENAGVGIAVRGDIVKSSVEIMLEHEKVDRPAIGVMIMPLMTEKHRDNVIKAFPTVKKEDIPNTWGLLVSPGKTDIPLQELPEGLEPFDVIMAINGEPINGGIDLSDELIKYKIGETITLMVIRNHRFMKVDITLKVFPVPVEKMYQRKKPVPITPPS
tara:strand:+ start:507 stop:1640 length:1134 start_codon:yes stop_codon:yes gene_type:complete